MAEASRAAKSNSNAGGLARCLCDELVLQSVPRTGYPPLMNMAALRPQPLPAALLLLPTEPSELERFVCGRLQRECALDGSFARRIRCGRAYPERRLLDREFLIAVVTAGVVRGADLEQ